MKKIIVTIFFAMMLYTFCYGYHVNSSSVTNDSISAIYKGIPGNGIFSRWLLLGPVPICRDNRNSEDQTLQKEAFDKDYILPSGASQFVNTKKLFIRNSSYKWQFVQDDNGIIDLTKVIGDNALSITYAYALIDMPEEQEFILGAGSDDAVKIWINGYLIHSNWAARGLITDNDLIHIKFKKGRNDILVKIQNRGGSWAFTCRAILPEQYTEKLISNTKIGQIENVKQLLKSGADINSLSDLGLTPLQTAYIYGQNRLINFFLEQGADSTIKMPPKEKIVDAYFNHIIKEYYPGAAVLISKEGRILYQKAYGYANLENDVPFKTDAKFRIGSVSKQFTTAAILKLQEQGLLNVNDPVSKYIPELPRSSEVTIHHLLTHTSGLQESWDEELFKNIPAEFKTDDIIKELKKLKYFFNPGESWRYSNMGYIVLSIIIEKVSGSSYYNFLSNNFFRQLGMINTGIPQRNDLFSYEILKKETSGYYYENSKIYRVYSLDRSQGAGALYSTLEDLFKWNEAVFNNNVLSAEDLKVVLTPVQANDGSPGKYGLYYGCGWFIDKFNGFKRVHHGGATDGYECSLNRYVDHNMSIIVFVNRFPFPPGINADIISQDIARIYLWEEMNRGYQPITAPKLMTKDNPDCLNIHGIHQDFVRIPEGEFLMGSDERPDEQPVHTVRVDSFDLAATEVTVLQFRAFVQATCYRTEAETIGSSFACCWRPKLGITWLNPGFLQNDNEPIVAISWNDATAYCRWLSAETGDYYRLPSEAEWEYACLAGKTSIDYLSVDSVAWYSDNSNGRTHPVGTKKENNWGLYDMLGNAWEWTSDVYHDNYKDAPKNSDTWVTGGSPAQRGYLKPGEGRVLRGGAWGLSAKNHPVSYDLKVTSRPVFGSNNSCNNSGFRVVRCIQKNNIKRGNLESGPSEISAGGTVFEFVWLKPGQFIMGNAIAGVERKPAHQVTFDHFFGIGKTEVTVNQFRSFVEQTGYITDAEKKGRCWDSDFRSHQACKLVPGLNWRNPGFIQTEKDPVTCMSWNDAMAFCNWLSSQTGHNIRLPSEAEWEYAATLGQGVSGTRMIIDSAWCIENSGLTTHPVGLKKPNNAGLFDMLGNVSEWNMDIWHPDYNGAPEDGSSWLGLPVTARVIRGGSFEREITEMGVQCRDWYDESEVIVGVGFRLLITENLAPFRR